MHHHKLVRILHCSERNLIQRRKRILHCIFCGTYDSDTSTRNDASDNYNTSENPATNPKGDTYYTSYTSAVN